MQVELPACLLRKRVRDSAQCAGIKTLALVPSSRLQVRWVYGDIVPDYMLGRETACLFLSLRFHVRSRRDELPLCLGPHGCVSQTILHSWI